MIPSPSLSDGEGIKTLTYIFGMLIHRDTPQAKYDGKGHRRKFKVIGGKQELSKC